MPLFLPVSANPPSTAPTTSQQNVRVLTPVLAGGTSDGDRPSLVNLPSLNNTQQLATLDLSSGIPSLLPTSLADGQTGFSAISLVGAPTGDTFSSQPASSFVAQAAANVASPDPGERAARQIGPSDPSDFAGALSSFMNAISTIESGSAAGNYQAIGPDTRWGTAKGRFQFIDDTWQRAARLVDGASQYPSATSAPAGVQDVVARAWFASLLERYNGNWQAVAIAHHSGEGTADKFMRTGRVGTADVLGTQTSDYANRALRLAFG